MAEGSTLLSHSVANDERAFAPQTEVLREENVWPEDVPGEQTLAFVRHIRGANFERVEHRGPDRRRLIHGIASTDQAVGDGLILLSDACELSLPLPLLFDHGRVATSWPALSPEEMKVGSVLTIQKSHKSIQIIAAIDHTPAGDRVWHLIESGDARALSVNPHVLRVSGIVQGERYVSRWSIAEISVGIKAANPSCWCAIRSRSDLPYI